MTAKTQANRDFQTQWTRMSSANAGFASGGFSASYDSFVVGSSAVLRLNFSAKNSRLWQYSVVGGKHNERHNIQTKQ